MTLSSLVPRLHAERVYARELKRGSEAHKTALFVLEKGSLGSRLDFKYMPSVIQM